MRKRPEILAFDVIETLFSLDPIAERLASVGLARQSLPIFFSRMLRDAFALEVSGVYRPFREVAAATLEVMMASSGVAPERFKIEAILEGFSELPLSRCPTSFRAGEVRRLPPRDSYQWFF